MALYIASLGVAGSAVAVDESIYFSELPVVASVSRLPQKLADAPTAVTVIDREIIKASGARDLNDVFRLVPGFQTYPNNTDAARVTYHGLTDEDFSPRVQILIDGRSLYSPLFRNGVNWATLLVALEDIERIEVVRGSNSASYGSNAFLGVINIITVDPALVRGFSVSTNQGNQGVRDYTLRNGGKFGEAGDFRFTYQQKDDNGLTDRFDWKDSFSSRLFDFRADFTLTDRDSLQFSAGHVEAVMQRGRLARNGDVLTGGSSPDWPIHDFSQSSSYLQVLWRHSLAADSDFQLRYSYSADWASDRFNLNKNGYLYSADEFGDHGTRNEIEAQHNFSPFERARVVWGAGWRSDALSSDTMLYSRGTVRREVARLFGNLEWKPATWFTGNLGASVDDDSLAGTHTSPRISASFHLNPENTVRLSYSRAYRTGSVVDYRGNEVVVPFAKANGMPFAPGEQRSATGRLFVGNPNLPAEQLDTLELGYLGDWRDWRMSLDVRGFQEKIPNRLVQVLLDPKFTAPVQQIRIEGVEYQWKWQPFEPTRIMVSQSFVHIYSEFLDDALATALAGANSQTLGNLDQLSERSAPRHATSAMLMQKLPLGLEFSLVGYWLDKMKWTRNTWAEKYTRVDTRLGYPFRLAGWSGEVAYTVQSLNGAHGEFKAYGNPADRIVENRHWLSLRLDF
ncbi:TonB-dependent receptor [Dechloromonas denitrificans]|uniref:TonB-dependent receptor n=1 Tax=Dechloromonas denitrificans TaxID=281362 RepID=A0A133XKZ8_9RHOO|nr:TonB-dependent receptor [Dechloromonas denitrificans]